MQRNALHSTPRSILAAYEPTGMQSESEPDALRKPFAQRNWRCWFRQNKSAESWHRVSLAARGRDGLNRSSLTAHGLGIYLLSSGTRQNTFSAKRCLFEVNWEFLLAYDAVRGFMSVRVSCCHSHQPQPVESCAVQTPSPMIAFSS